MDPLFSVEEAARRLGGVSPWTVRYWLSAGRLTRTKIGRRTMISESELLKFIQEGNKTSCSEVPRVGVTVRGLADADALKTVAVGARRLIPSSEIERVVASGAGKPRERRVKQLRSRGGKL